MLPSSNSTKSNISSSNNDLETNKKRLKMEPVAPGHTKPGGSSSNPMPHIGRPQNSGHHHSHHHLSGGGSSGVSGGTGSGHHYYHQPQNESKLYILTSIEVKDQIEITMEECFAKLQNLISPTQSNQPDNALTNELQQYSNQSKANADEVLLALLYSILTDPVNSNRSLRNIILCNNNFSFSSTGQQESGGVGGGSSLYATLVSTLMSIISDTYIKMQDVSRKQLLWLLKELTKSRVNQFERLLLQMLRNIQSGCLSEKNIWLAESLLDIFYEKSASGQMASGGSGTSSEQTLGGNLWICAYNELITQSVYTYLRIISDHALNPALNALRQRETDFCIQVLRYYESCLKKVILDNNFNSEWVFFFNIFHHDYIKLH